MKAQLRQRCVQLMLALLLSMSLAPGVEPVAWAAKVHKPMAHPAQYLANPRVPVVVILFSTPDCSFCEDVRRHTLRHLENDPRYKGQVRVFEVDQASAQGKQAITWFDGQLYTGQALAKWLQVKFAPTVLVFNKQGQTLGEPMLGAGLADFYGVYLDERIQLGLNTTR